MPTYQYACTTCDHRFEVVQSFSDEPLTECPACDGRLRKLFSAVGIVFKGSGFYRTDSRSGNTIPGKSDSKVPAGVGASTGKDASSTASTSAGSGTSSGGGAATSSSKATAPAAG
ncbi:MAG: FmdB family transcriptional regulator [Micromonosporaceae bacterium]|nr:FmdB family transcriptional regulator [Micromonosporaceae bacterium]